MENHLKADKMNAAARPCASCPWRKDSAASDIPNFSMQLAESLAVCSPDARNHGPGVSAPYFACHQSKPDAEFACAGWLAVAGHRHPRVRLDVLSGAISEDALAPGSDWPELHSNYGEVLEKLRAGD